MENSKYRTMEKLSLEDYVRFVDSGKQYDLTCELLKQVIHMHGYTKGKKTKSILREAVESIELMEPKRSTLEDESISANAFISIDEVVKDLVELKWQECCTTSIQMVNFSNYNFPALTDPVSTKLAIGTSSSPALVKKKKKEKKRNLPAIKNATKNVTKFGNGFGSAESACLSGGGGESGMSGGPFVFKRRARKKTKTLARFSGAMDLECDLTL